MHEHSSESWNPGGGREGCTVSISLVLQIVEKEGVLCGPAKIEPNSIAPVGRVLTCLTSGRRLHAVLVRCVVDSGCCRALDRNKDDIVYAKTSSRVTSVTKVIHA